MAGIKRDPDSIIPKRLKILSIDGFDNEYYRTYKGHLTAPPTPPRNSPISIMKEFTSSKKKNFQNSNLLK